MPETATTCCFLPPFQTFWCLRRSSFIAIREKSVCFGRGSKSLISTATRQPVSRTAGDNGAIMLATDVDAWEYAFDFMTHALVCMSIQYLHYSDVVLQSGRIRLLLICVVVYLPVKVKPANNKPNSPTTKLNVPAFFSVSFFFLLLVKPDTADYLYPAKYQRTYCPVSRCFLVWSECAGGYDGGIGRVARQYLCSCFWVSVYKCN